MGSGWNWLDICAKHLNSRRGCTTDRQMLKMYLASVVHYGCGDVAWGGCAVVKHRRLVGAATSGSSMGGVGQEPWELPGVQKLRWLSVGITNRNQPDPQSSVSAACLQSSRGCSWGLRSCRMLELVRNLVAHADAREGKWRGNWRMEWVASTLTPPPNVVYPALLKLMRTPRLPAVDWTDAPTDLNGLVRFGERRNLVSASVPSRSARAIPSFMPHLWLYNLKSNTDFFLYSAKGQCSSGVPGFLTNESCLHSSEKSLYTDSAHCKASNVHGATHISLPWEGIGTHNPTCQE